MAEGSQQGYTPGASIETPEPARAELAALLAEIARSAAMPIERAGTLPPKAYHDPALHQLEMERVFARDWLCPGRAADIPQSGDYVTFAIGRQPILVIRQPDGGVRAFANVCLHRMMRLVEGKGSCSKIVCPYHAWTYDLDGRLIGAPHMKRSAGFEPNEHALPEIRCEIWHGWIYVTLNDAAPGVATLLADLDPVVDRYRMADYVPVTTEDYVWRTNWKLLTENFMESYHLPVAHKKTVGAWCPVEETEFPDQRFDAFTYQTFTKDQTASYGLAHPSNTRLDGRWRFTSIMPTVFPTHMYVLAPDHLWYLSLRPKGVGEVMIRFGLAIAPEVKANLADPDSFTKDVLAFFDRVNAEDKTVVEGIYRGAQAPLSRAGRLSWLERSLHDFNHYLAGRLAQ